MVEAEGWTFITFGIIVTGKGEEKFLHRLLSALTHSGHCTFRVIRRIGQRSAITSERRILKMVGRGGTIPTIDESDIGLPSRQWLTESANNHLLLIDDLEEARRASWQAIYDRYRTAIDTFVGEEERGRASVHFLVPMLEAYYFANAEAINRVLGTELVDAPEDVETSSRHPKNQLKALFEGFDEVEHGSRIIEHMDLEHVLGNPRTCRALRTVFAWCTLAMGTPFDRRFALVDGEFEPITRVQLRGVDAVALVQQSDREGA